ncbi:hypothetical protein A7K91_06250 [Paenibacillus oryzae]|uniref:Flagellar protein FliT n=1 Tax=Paenibacillus oryzae TaxID=1844972 RepID=A0A1A5YD56_9BACL|nr:hypothetical protein [Paenibacillus oryzae]OBR63551.1 hypothetical protein A7K91_06250 [Paenibacillus oryzae]
MIQELASLYKKTRELVEETSEVPYEEFVELVEMRESIIQKLYLYGTLNETEKMYIQQISQLDNEVNRRMHEHRNNAAQQLKKLDETRKQRSGYDMDLAGESYFIDYRK